MALKAWIDEIKNVQSDKSSEAILEPGKVLADKINTLERIADNILFNAKNAIIKNGVFYSSPEVRIVEAEIDRAYKAILHRTGTFTALEDACKKWQAAAINKPEPAKQIRCSRNQLHEYTCSYPE